MREIDRQLAEMEVAAAAAAAETVGAATRRCGPERRPGASTAAAEEGGRRAAHPQSCNLEQLYHEALPLNKALSHSGPPAFGDTGRIGYVNGNSRTSTLFEDFGSTYASGAGADPFLNFLSLASGKI